MRLGEETTGTQNVPTTFGNFDRSGRMLRITIGCKTLRRSAEDFFKLAAEVGFVGKLEFTRSGFVGVPARDELFSEATLQFPEPMTRGAMKVLSE